MIRPCFLPVGMSTSNRIIKPGYESYQPVIAARQFGLGQVSPHFFLHHLTESRADLPDVLTGQRCYSFFDALAIPVPNNLSFTSSTDGFETWWSMWKTHAFRRALGPLLKQLDAEYNIPAEQQQDGPEPTRDDGSPFEFLPPAPVVLFCKSSPPLKKVVMQSQPISPKSASKSIFRASCPPSSNQGENDGEESSRQENFEAPEPFSRSRELARLHRRQLQRGDTIQSKGFELGQLWENHHAEPARLATIGFQEKTDDTSSGEVEEILMPATNLDPVIPKGAVDKVANLAKPSAETQEPITSSLAVPLVSGEGCGLLGLLTFDPESIEPAPYTACDEPRPSAVLRQFQRLQALLSSPIETLVEDPVEVKSVLEEIQHHLPVALQKKAALDAKTDTSVSTAELESLRKELEDLEERVRATRQLICDKEALIARSQEEAEGLKAQLKIDLAEIRALNQQLVTGKDEDDEAEIAEVDRVRADALRAFEAFLQ
ncbi:hypothetical protein QYE76_001176 [Lolium multiflorum]|uniref:Uncharacterized protein n=1 Tax=Lolium multiflorum TaxID=4521 RepID=A0AAD8RN96_LOLMU|nr:hypothetical protein QYE76_001176 [Lolium multiflorum]